MEKKKTSREEKVKSLRILKIDTMIREGNYPSCSKMMNEFEISRATLMRDLEFLRDRYNAPLEYSKEYRGYYYSDPSFFIQSVMLTEGELFSVSVIQPLLEQYKNTPLESSMKTIFGKIIDMLPQEISVDTNLISNDVSFISDPLPIIDQEVFVSIFEAIRNRKTILAQYRSAQDSRYTERKLDPLHVISRQGNWYLLAFSHKHQETRTFSLSRIKSIELTKNSFTPPDGFNPKDYYDSSFGVWNSSDEEQKVQLLFPKELETYVTERSFHKDQILTKNPDGTILLEFTTKQIKQVCTWVFTFGTSVKVLEPAELIQMIKETAKGISKQYE